MPEYNFICNNCKHKFNRFWKVSEYDKKKLKLKCPDCKNGSVYRDYKFDNTIINYIKGLHECKTLGEYADKQTKKYGKNKVEEMRRKFKTVKDPNSGMKELPSGMKRINKVEDLPKPRGKKRGKKNE